MKIREKKSVITDIKYLVRVVKYLMNLFATIDSKP